jgi:predicted ATPase/DNA-binding CsgD family transcriptional regulator/transcriptional regulator with XRE-family HTH domain
MADEPKPSFAGLLRQLRADTKLTQEELAGAARISPRAVSDLERGINRTAQKETATRLADALGLIDPVRLLFVQAARGRIAAQDVLTARDEITAAGSSAAAATRVLAQDLVTATQRRAGGLHGLLPALTSFVGRANAVGEVARLVDEYRLVTVTGPGGVGKTRLAGEVAIQVADRFADGVWLAELASVQDPAQLPTVVAAALGVPDQAGVTSAAVLAQDLPQRQLLLVLDNCEHVLAAAAKLARELLLAADDARILATSREPLGIPGEVRFRLPPMMVPLPDDPAGIASSEAIALFTERARRADTHFSLNPETGPIAAQVVARLDGMPLAIELAAARVEALGLVQLLDRLDDRFRLLTGTDRLAESRHRSLAAAADWSYQLLGEPERRVFRAVAAFPGPFSLDAAEAVAGPDAAPAVLHLVDCSLLSPPRTGPDGRARYLMLETLRTYGAALLSAADEQEAVGAAVARYALKVAKQTAARLQTSAREPEAAITRRLAAEDTTVHQGLAWALKHDQATALRLAVALAPWWYVRGSLDSGYQQLAAVVEHADKTSAAWCIAQFYMALMTARSAATVSLGHLTAVRDALMGRSPSPLLARSLAWRAGCLTSVGDNSQAVHDGRLALTLARDLADPIGEVSALCWLIAAAEYAGDRQDTEALLRQARQIDQTAVPAWVARGFNLVVAEALGEVGQAGEARHFCAEALGLAMEAEALYDQGDCWKLMARLDLLTGQLTDARRHLEEALRASTQLSSRVLLIGCLKTCGDLCATLRRWREAITIWAASDALHEATWTGIGLGDLASVRHQREQFMREARKLLGAVQADAAAERGAAMTPATATEFALLLVAEESPEPISADRLARLSTREQELISLVAQGRTDTQIAEQLYISVPAVRSHLDRIRDKTGCQRRTDLTRLALQANLV